MNDQQIINLLKGLVIDGVDQAQSGHPGGAMSSMDFAYTLFAKHLRFDPDNPNWLGRDRFILSAGHESMLLYSLLYANGWLNLEDLKGFRQLGSRTPGHPENGVTPGVECTTGPLGQGAAMSVGFAIGSSHLAAVLDQKLFQSRTWVLMGDGCMQEGVTLGAASIAGHLKLGHLIWYYDKNCQQISGNIDRATSDDEKKIFEGFGWQVLQIDGHDHEEINYAINVAKQETSKPTLIVGRSIMAHGAANVEGSHKTHGAPLSSEERKETKHKFAIPSDESFYFPAEARTYYQQNFAQLRNEVQEWQSYLAEKRKNDIDFSNMYDAFFTSNDYANLPLVDWQKDKPMATRNSFGEIISCWAKKLPTLIGGSADLEPSNMTEGFAKLVQDYGSENPKGRNLAFGVREFPMSAICNGLALYGGFVPFDATFLSFADYSRAALRLGSIQHARVIHEFTHDSFYVGEDGPTHQPIEHIMSLRAIPNMYVMRPADSLETEVLMRKAISLDLPSSICLTRQKLPYLPVSSQKTSQAEKGAWRILEKTNPTLIIFATGSEVSLALDVAKILEQKGENPDVISVPCWELFQQQNKEYREEILNWNCKKRVSIEAGVTLGWERFVGADGLCIGIDHFGASAPAQDLEREFGFTTDAIVKKIEEKFY